MSLETTLPRRIDLHTHSTASDGIYTPAELVRLAREVGLSCIALADHDTTDGIAEAQEAGRRLGLAVIGAIEINTDLPEKQGEAHVLGYFVDGAQVAFQSALGFLQEARMHRGQRIVARLRDAGIDIEWERVRELAHGSVGRPHVAQALIEKGYAGGVSEAFEKYLVPGKPGYIPRYRLTPEDAVRLIRSAWGVPVLAHPSYVPGLEERVLPSLVAAGMQGLECYYGQYADAMVERLLGLAAAHGLIPTGGSDFHGPGLHPTPLGGRYVPPETEDALRERAERNRAEPHIPVALEESRP